MAKRLTACLLIVALILPLAGCWSYRSLDQVTIVVGISVDYDKKQNLFNVGFEATDMPGGDQESSMAGKVIFSQGKTMFDSARNAKRREADRLFFGGTDVVVINQELAHDMGVLGVLEWILRDGECRENMTVAISQEDTAKDILDGSGEMNVIISRILEEIIREDKDVTATTYPMQAYEIYNSLNSPRRSAFIPAIRKVQNGKDQLPELNGTAVIKDNRLVGYLTPEQSRYALFVENKIKGGILTLSTSKVLPNDDLSLEIFYNKAKKSYTYENGQMTVKIKTMTYVAVAENQSHLDMSDKEMFHEIESVAAQMIEDKITDLVSTLQHNFHTDALGFGEMIFQKDNKFWREIETSWEDIYPTVKVEVSSKVEVANSAFII